MNHSQESRAARPPAEGRGSSLKKLLPIAACWVGLIAAGCSRQQAAPPAAPVVPVAVATVVQKSVPVQVRAIGNVEALTTVAIKPQISGQLVGVHFVAGQDVRKGDLLFKIDSRPFEVALQEARANFARDKARAENARIQAGRYAKLLSEGVVSSQQNDLASSEADALEALVQADQAAVEKAKLDLQYCAITAPMDGRTGGLLVHRGNLVKANDVPVLAVINQITPIYVRFSVPEQYLADVKKYMAAGKLKVQAVVPEDPKRPEEGVLSFVDNAVDMTTGTILMKATFANQQRRLWPGEYVDVVITLTAQSDAVVVPAQALQTGQNGQYVFVVKSDQTAESRPVVAGRTVEGETIVEKGLRAGETVVTDGQLRLVPGSKVKFKGAPETGQQSNQDKRS
ncbi:MAG: efflux RND transporter periplasmic adaptor subunit [Candidatus Acidiferrales bacterium]